MYHILDHPKLQEVPGFKGLNKKLSDKQALKSELNCEDRLTKLTGKPLKKRRGHQDYRMVERELRKLPKVQRRVVDVMMKFNLTFDLLTFSAITISHMANCSLRTVYTVYARLRSLGLIIRTRRGRRGTYKNSSITCFNPIIHHPYVKARLWTLYESFKHLFQQASKNLLLCLLFYPICTLNKSNSYNYQSREVNIKCSIHDIQPKVDTHIREVESPMVPITEFLRNDVTKTLHLTKKGQLYLSAFTDEALKHAIEGLRHLGNNSQKDNFKLFLNLCYSYSHEHKLIVQTERADDLIREYGCKEFGPYYLEAPTCLGEAGRRVIPTVKPAPVIEAQPTKPRRMIAINPLFNDVFIAMALRRGDEDRLDMDKIKSNFNVDA